MKNLFAKIRNPKILRILSIIFTVFLVVGGYFFYQLRHARVYIDDSLVQSPIINIAPTTPGTLQELDVYENEKVRKGDTIAIVAGQPVFTNTDGLIVTAQSQIGSIVGSQNPVAQMVHIPDMRIAGTLDENKGLSDIRIGQVASFTVDALAGQTFWGYVDEISPTAKVAQVAFSISSERPTQQFVVYVRYDGTKYPQIKNGMSAKLTIYTDTN